MHKIIERYFLQKVSSIYETIYNTAKEIILLDDFNIDTLKEDNAIKHELYYIYNVEDLVHELTCFKWPEGTLIDHIIVKNPRENQ